MCLQLRDALTVGSISLSSHFFSIKMDVKDALKALGNEMRAFAILVEPPKTTFGKVRRQPAARLHAPLPTLLFRNRCAKRIRARWAASKTTRASRCSWR